MNICEPSPFDDISYIFASLEFRSADNRKHSHNKRKETFRFL